MGFVTLYKYIHTLTLYVIPRESTRVWQNAVAHTNLCGSEMDH